MRQVAVIALVVALCAARVSAHSWMVSPASRNGNQAVQGTGPCDAGPTTARVQYNAGATLTVTYNTGTHGGNYIAAIVASGNLPTSGGVSQNGAGVIAYLASNLAGPAPSIATHTLTIPADTPTGDYTVQYWWSTNYFNCADIRVINTATGGLGGPGGPEPNSSSSTAAAAAGGVIGGIAIAAVILAMAVLYKRGGCRLSSGVAVFPGAAASTAASTSAVPQKGLRPAASRPAPLNAVSVAPRNGVASPRTMAAAVVMAGEPGERPLPPNWDTAIDDKGNLYYYHVHTNQVQWERPVA